MENNEIEMIPNIYNEKDEKLLNAYLKLEHSDEERHWKDDQIVLPSILNLDEYFSQLDNPIIINKIPYTSNYMNDIIKTIADSREDHSLIASCECKNLVGNFYEGLRCPKCNTIVKGSIESSAINDIWIEIPPEIKGVMNPQIYAILREWFKSGSSTYHLDNIFDVTSPLKEEFKDHIKGRGFNYFYDNFEYIMNFFMYIFPKTANSKSKNHDIIKIFLEKNKDKIWCTKLPLLSSILQPITSEGHSLKYVNKNIKTILSSIIDLIDIRVMKKTSPVTLHTLEKIMYDIYSKYLEYSTYTKVNKLAQKTGVMRQHIFGTRLHFTFRSVIVPIVEPHEGDELHIPWKIGINCLKYHIMNILINRRGYSMKDAYAKIIKAFNKYDFEIDQIIQLLIKECPYKGFPVAFNRNPSLNISAIQLLFITKVKPRLSEKQYQEATLEELNAYIHDEAIGFSTMIVKGPNADYDGDEMNGSLIFEMDEVPKYISLHPMSKMISPITMCMDDEITLTNQLFVSLNGWLNDE